MRKKHQADFEAMLTGVRPAMDTIDSSKQLYVHARYEPLQAIQISTNAGLSMSQLAVTYTNWRFHCIGILSPSSQTGEFANWKADEISTSTNFRCKHSGLNISITHSKSIIFVMIHLIFGNSLQYRCISQRPSP